MKKTFCMLALVLLIAVGAFAQNDHGSKYSSMATPVPVPHIVPVHADSSTTRFGVGILVAQKREWKFTTTFRLSPRVYLYNSICTDYVTDGAGTNEEYFRKVEEELQVRYIWMNLARDRAVMHVYSAFGIRSKSEFYPDPKWWVPWNIDLWWAPTWAGVEVFPSSMGGTLSFNLEIRSVNLGGDFYESVGMNIYLSKK